MTEAFMKEFTNPLDNIRVASPCKADWNGMNGNARKRFCADCKLNVYNLSEMTRDEAESFLLASEGRVCLRYFRRADGSVLTRNCPVGWQAVKRRVSRTAAAAFSVVAGFLSGVFALRALDSTFSVIPTGDVPPVENPAPPVWEGEEEVYEETVGMIPVAGDVDLTDFRRAMKANAKKKRPGVYVIGRRK